MLTASKKIFGTLLFLVLIMGVFTSVTMDGKFNTAEVAFAEDKGGTDSDDDKGGDGSKSSSLVNPLKFNSIEGLFVGILSALMVIMMPIIVFFIIYAGFLYVTARGNAEQVKKATSALTYAVIGGVIVIGALAIAQIVKGIIEPFAK